MLIDYNELKVEPQYQWVMAYLTGQEKLYKIDQFNISSFNL